MAERINAAEMKTAKKSVKKETKKGAAKVKRSSYDRFQLFSTQKGQIQKQFLKNFSKNCIFKELFFEITF